MQECDHSFALIVVSNIYPNGTLRNIKAKIVILKVKLKNKKMISTFWEKE
jgi:hypothetical protein